MSENKFIFTTSWDDGDPLNLKLVNLLNKYGIQATFYLEGKYLDRPEASAEILEINSTCEIGAHSFSHPKLNQLKLEEVEQEIILGKTKIENLLKKKVEVFAYPYGFYNSSIIEILKKIGFLGARTTEGFVIKRSEDFFKFGTTLQIYPHPFRKKDAKHFQGIKVIAQPLIKNYPIILKSNLSLNSLYNWLNLAKNLFNYAYQEGEIFHLWGHAWEIEKYGMWEDLENFFQYLKKYQKINFFTNSQTLKYFNENTSN